MSHLDILKRRRYYLQGELEITHFRDKEHAHIVKEWKALNWAIKQLESNNNKEANEDEGETEP